MNIAGTDLEKICKFLLQKHISLEFKNKTYKSGRLVLFHQKNYFLVMVLDKGDNMSNIDKVEIPIPFGIELHKEDDLLYFDYRLRTLAKDMPQIEPMMRLYQTKTASNKFWDSILTISINHDK